MPRTIRWWDRDITPGLLLLAATLLSFLLLNGPTADAFHHALEAPFAFGATAHLVINDGLMAVFFLFVGLELKREFQEGPFRDLRAAALPMAAALGGMVAPALIYLSIAGAADPALARGWAIPAATDIAFAIGALSLLGSRVPAGLRLFLLALAVIDDLGAIVVIAVFYTQSIAGWAFASAGLVFVLMLIMNRWGVRALAPYWLAAAALWGFMLLSGVHATIAGVLAALAIPMRREDGRSPLIAAEHVLKPYVQLGVMPVFALANAGVSLSGVGLSTLVHPVALGAGLGLIVGKPLGIISATFAVSALLQRPLPCSLSALAGISFIAGIGFTMSLFIGGLAFGAGELAAPVRIGVLGGSLVSAIVGLLVLRLAIPGRTDPALHQHEQDAQDVGIIEDR